MEPVKKGKQYVFGTVKMSEKGQIVIPKEARKVFNINSGDMLLVLGDEEKGGLALMKFDTMRDFAKALLSMDGEDEKE